MKQGAVLLYRLSKPGIVYGNMVHILVGCLLAYGYGLKLGPIIGVVIGTSLVIASACVANNYIDRHIDAHMKRTKQRALVTGAISVKAALIFSAILLLVGFAVLAILTNLLVCAIGATAYIFYVFIYAWAKRYTIHSTLVGSIPGALPAMAGYVAISGQLDTGAWLIFLLVVAWQMPHFYAISLFRKKEYQQAKLPVLGVVAPTATVVNQIIGYTFVYCIVIILLVAYQYFGLIAGIIMLTGAIWWLSAAFNGRDAPDIAIWARNFFGRSLVLTLLLLVVSGLNIVLP